MDFGEVLREMRIGREARRAGWGRQVVFLEANEFMIRVTTSDGTVVAHIWAISPGDLLAEDWEIAG